MIFFLSVKINNIGVYRRHTVGCLDRQRTQSFSNVYSKRKRRTTTNASRLFSSTITSNQTVSIKSLLSHFDFLFFSYLIIPSITFTVIMVVQVKILIIVEYVNIYCNRILIFIELLNPLSLLLDK